MTSKPEGHPGGSERVVMGIFYVLSTKRALEMNSEVFQLDYFKTGYRGGVS